MTHVLKYERAGSPDVPGWDQANALAIQLQSAACDGTDPALSVPLPHTRAITYSRRGMTFYSMLVLPNSVWTSLKCFAASPSYTPNLHHASKMLSRESSNTGQ